jgi:ATP-dependent Lhr-like helicase
MQVGAFELLHPKVQQIVLDRGWSSLYPVQEDTIRCFWEGRSDLMIVAPTSGGKTEAVFLPIISDLMHRQSDWRKSVQVVCVSPLKALINDQYARLTKLCEPLGLHVHRWHGDVDIEIKRRIREKLGGILFITPESLESIFVNYAHRISRMFHGLQYVVIDELHALLETERGMHVRSLLSRLFAPISQRPRCFGLSATLGDPLAARHFLNRAAPESVEIIADRSTGRPILVEVISAMTQEPVEEGTTRRTGRASRRTDALGAIAEDLRQEFRCGSFLVFANSRRTVEELGDLFRGDCELVGDGEPAVALHHGSLATPLRRRTERKLKSGRPTRALCTSSLELGIDIGAVEAVGQIDPPWSVSSMVQRLGRSGRRIGSTSKLRLYVRIGSVETDAALVDLLFPQLLQAIAMTNLLLAGWLEPVNADRMHWSTLVHQILSVIKETGGQTALNLYKSLCRTGPFRRVEAADFGCLLQGLHDHDIIDQVSDNGIILGMAGEKIASAPGFYAAFSTPVELTARWGARQLGRLPWTESLKPGECLLLNGQRWVVDNIDWKSKSIWMSPTDFKKPTVFLGDGGEIHDRVFQEMRRVLLTADEPAWLDARSLDFLRSARQTAQRVGLDTSHLLELEEGVQWFPWVGTRSARTLHLWVKQLGLRSSRDFLSLTIEQVTRQELEEHLADLADNGADAVALAAAMPNKETERFDEYVPAALLDKANATDRLDVASARRAAEMAIGHSVQREDEIPVDGLAEGHARMQAH